MNGNDLARSFLDSVAGFTGQPEGSVPSQDKPVKLGTVDPGYSGAGNPQVLFDGESLMGISGYPYSGVQPVSGDRVVLLPQGRGYVIIGSVGKPSPAVKPPGGDLPAGTSIEGHWTSAPSGFLLEDGAVYGRSAYPELFAVLGTRYNIGGETSTQFRLPDSTGRVAVDKTTSGTFSTLGSKNGSETVTLTSAQMPSHTHVQNNHGHNMTDPGHTHGYGTNSSNAVFSTGGGTGMDNKTSQQTAKGYTGITADGTTAVNQSTGGGGSHSNLQPYIVVLRVVKT